MNAVTHVSFKRTELISAIEIARLHAATEDNRPVLNRVNFIKQDNSVYVVGADGYRMSLTRLEPSSLDFVDCGIDLSDIKLVLKHLKSLKGSSVVDFVVSTETLEVERTREIKARYVGIKPTSETYTETINLHRINVAGLELTSVVGKLPDVFNLIPETQGIPTCRVDCGAMLHAQYEPLYKAQNAARKAAVAALGDAARYKADRHSVEKLYRVTHITLSDIIKLDEVRESNFNSSYIYDALKALKDSAESTTVQLIKNWSWDRKTEYPSSLYICSDSTRILIMPRSKNDLTSKCEIVNLVEFVLYA